MSGQAGEGVNKFTKYLSTVWGSLSGLSLLFPLSNTLLKAIPVYGEASLHTGLASVVSTFFVWVIYSFRMDIAKGSRRSRQFISIITFFSGLATLLDYRNLIFENPPMPDFRPRNRALSEYSLIFSLWTISFTLLAMYEYMMHVDPKSLSKELRTEASIHDIIKMHQDTRNEGAPKLGEIIEEEIESPDE